MSQIFFQPLRKILDNIINLDVDEIAFEIARTSKFKRLVIGLNTEGEPTSQLFELGEDSKGKLLSSIGGNYSPFTLQKADEEGRPKRSADLIDLKDTGAFYKTFDVIPFKGGFKIEANTKLHGDDLQDSWGKEIVGLNSDNLQIVIDFYKQVINEAVRKRIKAA